MSQDHHDHDDHIHPAPTTFLTKYVFTIDHKVIGLQFLFASIAFIFIGGLLALGVRYQLAWPDQDVPYARMLPTADGTDVMMTQPTPEPNLALWQVNTSVQLAMDVQADGKTFPAGTRATFKGFPQGLSVLIPIDTLVRPANGGDTIRLSQTRHGRIDFDKILGSYNYKGDFVDDGPIGYKLAFANAGTVLTMTDEEGKPLGDYELVGVQRLLPKPGGLADEFKTLETIELAIRPDATPVTLDIPEQTVGEGENAVQIAGTSIDSVMGTSVSYQIDQLTKEAYMTLFTMHATIMVFFVLMPLLLGAFGNFLIPLMVGARDMAFPKLNMLSFWISVPAGIIMLFSFWVPGGASGGGWTMYPTHSNELYSSGMGATLWLVSIALVGFVTIVGTLNYITTIINMRAPGLTMFRLPLTMWGLLTTSVLALFATPVLTAAGIMLLFDRILGTVFFMPMMESVVDAAAGSTEWVSAGGQPLLWQHLFWFFGHPEVYILILPTMGIASDILAVHARKPIFGYKPMVFAMAAISILGFIVWGHHMFQSGMNPTLGTTFMAATIMIAVPSAIKTFNWLGTIWGGNIRFTTPMLFAIGFVGMFVIGGLSGIFMAAAPVDMHLHDTYFIVGHIHYVFFGGTLMGVFAGVYHWYPKMFGRMYNERWGKIHFWLTVIALNGTFFLMHIIGIGGHPRRYASIMEFPSLVHLQDMNVFMTICAMMLGMAQLPFLFNFFGSMPRKLSRGVILSIVLFLTLPTVIGHTYWGGFQSGIMGSLFGHVGQIGGAGNFAPWQEVLGTVLFLGLLAFLTILLLWQLPKGGKIGAGITMACVWIGTFYLIQLNVSGNHDALSDTAATLRAAGDYSAAFITTCKYVFGYLIIAIGLSTIYIAAATVAIFLIWEISRVLNLTTVIGKALYVLFLPLYMLPVVVKKDVYMWLDIPQLAPTTWVGVVGLLAFFAIPGTLYLLLARPRDEFGAIADRNPWQANSLEWVCDSPPVYYNFEHIPTVHRGPYEYSSPAVEKDYLPQPEVLPAGVVEPTGH